MAFNSEHSSRGSRPGAILADQTGPSKLSAIHHGRVIVTRAEMSAGEVIVLGGYRVIPWSSPEREGRLSALGGTTVPSPKTVNIAEF